MRNTDPQWKCSSRSPPTTGPTTAPTTLTIDHTAMAVLRWRASVNVRRMSARVAGIIGAAPTARRTRAAMSVPGEYARAQAREATPNTAIPKRNIRRWPSLSPSVPAPRSRPDMTTV